MKFHDGSPFNADAVVFAFDRIMKKDGPAQQALVKAVIAGNVAAAKTQVATLQAGLAQWHSDLNRLALSQAGMPAWDWDGKVLRLSVKHGLTIDPQLEALLDSIPTVREIKDFGFRLKDFQAEGVAWLERQGGRGLLADEQGTGKTVQVTAYAHKNRMFPMLVVCPNTLKLNWRNEIIAMTGQLYRINVVGKEYSKRQTLRRAERHPNVVYSKVPTAGCDIYIVNYDILAANVGEFEALGLRYMAVDESHKIKNPEAKRTKAMLRLAVGEWDEKQRGGQRKRIKVGDGIQAVTLMSGTPAGSRPVEMWTSVQTVAPWVPEFSKFTRFGFRYCGAQQNGHGWDFSGATNTGELNSLLTRHCMLRRLKADVLKELPPKVYRTLPLEFDRREYDKVEAAFNGINWQAGMQAIVRCLSD